MREHELVFVTGDRSPSRLSRNVSSVLKTQDGGHTFGKEIPSVRSPKKKTTVVQVNDPFSRSVTNVHRMKNFRV